MTTEQISVDVRDFTGVRTARGLAVAVIFMTAIAWYAWSTPMHATMPWLSAVAFIPMIAAAVGLILLPGDPLPARSSVVLVALVVLSTAMVAWQEKWVTGELLVFWPIMPAVIFLTFLCTRGPIVWAWIGFAAMALVLALWTQDAGVGWATGIGVWSINVAPLLMATFFSRVMRPMARFVVLLREGSNRLAAAESAAAAREHERTVQLDALEQSIGPILERLAAGGDIDEETRRECRLVEARLRDGLRARALVDDSISDAARDARERGAMVVLLDDGGSVQLASPLLDTVRATIATELSGVGGGKLTARILPPGRDLIATVHIRTENAERRVAVDRQGKVVVDV